MLAWVRACFLRGCPLEEVFEEVLWRGGSINGSAGLGGPRTTVPLAGTRDVPGTTCRAWARPAIFTTFLLFNALLGNYIVAHVFNSVFPQTAPIDAFGNARV
ncbi:UNVERIFIED_CONTAM: hypothetical protein Slati_2732400 [Sesamum latifolium]|uniref:Uncharacterized protein n=1 Tax=Sesamum latifolium TaxID=2727402 RepID=A0AAW2VZS6_9LAMI